MRPAISLLYFMSLTRGIVTKSRVPTKLLQSYDIPLNDETRLQDLLKELMSGPLLGRSVTILLEEERLLKSFQADVLMEVIYQPVYLLRLPQEMPETMVKSIDDTGDLVNVTDFTDVYSADYYPLMHSVLVIILEPSRAFWWPLWYPPTHWNPEALILIVSSTPCLAKNYLETPLLAKPSFLAVICPHEPHRPPQTLMFKVWTWRLFSSGPQLVDLGFWEGNSFQNWDQLFIDRFRDMGRKNMSILAQAEDRPLIYVTPEGTVKGLNYIIMDTLKHWLKFNLTYETNMTLQWPTILDSIKRGVNDVFVNYATITEGRNKDFDFTVPYHREGFAMILEVPPPLPRWQNILFPFTWWVWGAVMISTLLSTIVYHALSHQYNYSLIDNGIIIFMSLLSIPVENLPQVSRIQIYLLFWSLASWFVNTCYKSNLVAVLTIPVFPTKIQTAEGIANSKYRLCMLDYGEFVDEALAKSTHPVLSRLSKILDMVPVLDNMEYVGEEQCMELVLAGTHAHIETFSYIKILYNKVGHGAQVYSLKEQLYLGHLAFLVKKHAPWKYKFDTGMQWMLEAGLIHKWYKDSMDEFSGYFETKPISDLMPLSVAHLQGPFLVYILSILGAILVLVWEILFPPKKHRIAALKGAVMERRPILRRNKLPSDVVTILSKQE